MTGKISYKRIYESREESDGTRILIDRLWPRGISKVDAALSLWAKQVAPSDALRKAYHAGEINYDTFAARYAAELDGNEQANDFIKYVAEAINNGNVTLLYASKTPAASHVPTLKRYIDSHIKQ